MAASFTRFRTGYPNHPKTVGVLFDLTDTGFDTLDAWTAGEAITIYKLTSKFINYEKAAAKGKVIFINRKNPMPEVLCFQANGKQAELAWCGNAYAAVAAYLHQNGYQCRFHVYNNNRLLVSAKVNKEGNDFAVAQGWIIERQYILNESGLCQESPTIYLSFLNDYRIIIAKYPDQFDLQYSQLTTGLNALRLTEKICLLNPSSGRVAFFSASYAHGGAPITGLCSLALLKHKVSWLVHSIPDRLLTPSGEELLPELSVAGSDIIMNINPINVNLETI